MAACSGGDDDDDGGRDTESSAAEFERADVALRVSRAHLVSPHKPRSDLEATTRDAVTGVVERLLLVTSAQPLVEGKAGGGFAQLFTAAAGTRAAGADRAVLFDEGVPRFGGLDPVTSTIAMTGLAGSMDPATKLVVATFRWDVTSTERPGDRIVREGQLSLIPAGGTWKIGAYTVVVTRTLGAETTTTTASTERSEDDG